MKDKDKLLPIMLILVIMMSIIIAILINLSNNKEKNIDSEDKTLVNLDSEQEGKELSTNYQKILLSSITKYEYYNVQNCAQVYINKLNELQTNNTSANKMLLYNMLDEEYTENKQVTIENIEQIYNDYKGTFIIDKILATKLSNNVSAYLVKGKLVNVDTIEKSDYSLIVKLDAKDSRFSIYPYEYILEKKYNTLEENQSLNIEEAQLIKEKTVNIYEDQSNQYSTIAISYFQKMKQDFTYDAQYLYQMLDTEYKQKRFGNYNNFEQYVNNMKQNIENAEVEKYSRTYHDGYIQYICVDNYGRYYIFKEIKTLDYSIQLDDYTLETEEFKTKYAQSNTQTKIITNVDKLIKMLNNKDYSGMYNLLNETYKSNNFKTLASYQNFLTSNFFNINECVIDNISEQGEYYVITLNISDESTSNSSKTVTVNIVMALATGTNFTMSYMQ